MALTPLANSFFDSCHGRYRANPEHRNGLRRRLGQHLATHQLGVAMQRNAPQGQQLPVPIGWHGVEQQATRDTGRQVAGNGQRLHGEKEEIERQNFRALP